MPRRMEARIRRARDHGSNAMVDDWVLLRLNKVMRYRMIVVAVWNEIGEEKQCKCQNLFSPKFCHL